MKILIVPERLDGHGACEFACHLLTQAEDDEFVFDFSLMKWTDPFGMLYASKAIKHLKDRFPDANYYARGYENHTYAGHMGFFQAFGLEFGKKPGAAQGNNNYLPLTELSITDIYSDARNRGIPIGEIVDEHAGRLANVLTRQLGEIFDTVRYALREIIRNSAEHSGAQTLSFCAQYWPVKRRVEIGIIDTGVGIRHSLSKNPFLKIDNDCDALTLAIMPGVSGKMYEGVEVRPYDSWQNSGYGLYMISRICRNAGSFVIMTSGGRLGIVKNKHISEEMNLLPGTAIRIHLDPSRFISLTSQLKTFAREGQEIATQIKGAGTIKASAASLMLRTQ